jgi:hypothetical protein
MTATVTLPEGTYVYTDDDHLDTSSAPVENGTADQAGGEGPL